MDMDVDWHVDLITGGRASNTVAIHRGTGTGTFAAAEDYGAGEAPTYLAVGNVNAGNRPDVFILLSNQDAGAMLLNACR